ncbi:PAS domain S-box protein [Schlegelella sp. S2-27]|uniref:histidine kinase n=1 Tax=Caldimonas mangrovi TaxID=2944811 RepID=A0ABT0YL55_9BURK|nr:PAS domain S-box protein [Caldimonas mangrovi]MCM5679467.1 PAS domain S-box protein [Caldimonas mangrovi]
MQTHSPASSTAPFLADAGVSLGELTFVAVESSADGRPWVASAAGALNELLGKEPTEVLGQPLNNLLEGVDELLDAAGSTADASHTSIARLKTGSHAQGYVRAQPLHAIANTAWLVSFHTLRPSADDAQQRLPALAGLPFAGLAHAVPALLFAASPDGASVYVNRHWFDYTGLPTHRSLADEWLALIHPDDHSSLMRSWHHAAAQGGRFEAEFRLRNADGEFRWHLCRARLITDHLGEPLLWAGMATEIEHQKRVEDALDQREREFRTLVENAPDIITRLDRELHHVYANRATENAFGVPPARLIGRTPEQAGLPRVVADHWRAAAVAALASAEEQECEFSVSQHPGRAGPVSHYICRLIPERSRDGEVETVLCIGYDITQRRRAMAALEESELRFRQFAESTEDVFWLADVATEELLYVSPAFERVWGMGCQSLYSDPARWNEALLPRDREELPEPFFGGIGGGTKPPPVREYRIRQPGGQVRWIRDRRFHLRDDAGRVVRVGGVAEDITERKERELERDEMLERERALREQAEALTSAKDEFLAVVSHELRSPLNAIRGWAHVLRQTGQYSAAQLRALDAIDRNTQTQARMVDDLLDMQRALRGKLQLEARRTALAPMLEQAVDTFRPNAEAKRIALELRHDPGIDMVCVDVDRLRQALVNLISNAVKFTPEDGRIDVSSRLRPHALEIEVRDSGIGIEDTVLPQLFERFRQADGSSTRRAGGLGLGLSLARQLIELHGGRLSAHSEGVGRGTSFVIELPRRLAEEAPLPDAAVNGDTPALAGKRLVVIEDDADGREILGFILSDQNAQLSAFDRAPAAFEHLCSLQPGQRPDAVISDIAMPEEDGYSFMRRWRRYEAEHGLPRVPALALTAFSSASERAKALKAGFDGHLGKPIDSPALIDTLLQLLRRTQAA